MISGIFVFLFFFLCLLSALFRLPLLVNFMEMTILSFLFPIVLSWKQNEAKGWPSCVQLAFPSPLESPLTRLPVHPSSVIKRCVILCHSSFSAAISICLSALSPSIGLFRRRSVFQSVALVAMRRESERRQRWRTWFGDHDAESWSYGDLVEIMAEAYNRICMTVDFCVRRKP